MTTADLGNDTARHFKQVMSEGTLKSVTGQGSTWFGGEMSGFNTETDHMVLYDRVDGSPIRVRREDRQFLMARAYNPDRRKLGWANVKGGVTQVFVRPKPGIPAPSKPEDYEFDPDAPPVLSAFTETPPDPVDMPVQLASAGQAKARTPRRRRGRRGRRK